MGFRVEGSLAERVKKFGKVCRVCDWGVGTMGLQGLPFKVPVPRVIWNEDEGVDWRLTRLRVRI